jgi:hypothetical protein
MGEASIRWGGYKMDCYRREYGATTKGVRERRAALGIKEGTFTRPSIGAKKPFARMRDAGIRMLSAANPCQ